METVIIKDSLNNNRYEIDIENNNVVRIYSKDLRKYFENHQWTYDFQRYVELNQKDLNNIGFMLINNKNDWKIINKCHDLLFKLLMKHYEKYYNKNGILKNKYYKYSVIAYRCCPFIHRKYKSIDYINQLIGIYANQL